MSVEEIREKIARADALRNRADILLAFESWIESGVKVRHGIRMLAFGRNVGFTSDYGPKPAGFRELNDFETDALRKYLREQADQYRQTADVIDATIGGVA